MASILRFLRYAVFALFVICNGIIASAAIWNLFLGHSQSLNVQVDGYLASVGIIALAFIFVVIFLQLAFKNSHCSRVWFECVWVAAFLVLELVGAIAASIVLPPVMCSAEAQLSLVDSCLSTHLLIAFLWICTLTLLGYSLLLSVSALLQSKKDKQIWHCPVHNFPWATSKRSLPSAPTSPAMEDFYQEQPTITTVFAAPKPRLAQPSALYLYRGGLGSQYEIEYFNPAITAPAPAVVPTELQEVQITRQTPETSLSLYPKYMQPALSTQPQSSLRTSAHSPPPPLGSWPNANATISPKRIRNLSQPEAASRASRPAGPRIRTSDGSVSNRPPPLDLSKITSFKESSSAAPQ